MTETGTQPAPAGPMRRSLRYVLIGSLAFNLLVLGILGGAILHGPEGFRPPRGVDLALGPIVEALAPEDRQAIRADLRGRDALQLHPRQERDALITALLVALRAQTYDPDAVAAALAVPRARAVAVQQAAQQALLARISAMTPGSRLAFADRLAEGLGRGGPGGEDPPQN